MSDSSEQESAAADTGDGKSVYVGWWRQYIDQGGRASRNADPGVRARLRRCRSWSDALAVPAAHDLARRLRVTTDDPQQRVVAVFNLARVLGHVTEHVSQSLMERAGAPADGPRTADSRACVAETRYRRLVQAEAGDELADMIIRLLAQLKGKANVAKLGNDLLWWNDYTRVGWAFQYFGKSIAHSNAPIVFDISATNPPTPSN